MSQKVYLHCIGCPKKYIYTVQDVQKSISTLYRMSQKLYLHCTGCPKKIYLHCTGCPKKAFK